MSRLVHRIAVLFVVASLMLGSAAPVRAQDNPPATPTPTIEVTPPTPDVPDGTPVSPTPTSTPVATEMPNASTSTATPTVSTPVPTVTQPAAPAYTLEITTHPGFLTRSRNVNVEWTISGMTEGQTGLTLAIALPDGYEPKKVNSGEAFDTAARIYTVPVTAAQGMVQIRAEKVKTNVSISASLLRGTESLAGDALILPVHQQFDVNAGGGEIVSTVDKVKVIFPSGALAENAQVNIGFPTDDALPKNGFSDKVFELKANAKNDVSTGLDNPREISHFNAPLTIEVDYSDMVLTEKQENQLALYWYNEEVGEWYGMETRIDRTAKTLRVQTDHFTVFDVGVQDWQLEELPTMESFQTSQFTGAATYSMPIKVPDGPGGFKPNITLSYNSQVVDQATTETQASWVGMGWSLDGGGVISDNGDGTYSLTVNGVSTLIIENSAGVFHAVDENFWKITYVNGLFGKPDSWTVYDTQGNRYYFGIGAYGMPYMHPVTEVYYSSLRAWYLTSATSPAGQEITYEYEKTSKPVLGVVVNPATYLTRIAYNGYEVLFTRGDRGDYSLADAQDGLFHLVETQRLNAIEVKKVGGATIRKYAFGYAGDENQPASGIWPGFIYTGSSNNTEVNETALTLTSVTEYGAGGTTALPAQTFTYDDLHLKEAKNGYGGMVTFTYAEWHSTATLAAWLANPIRTLYGCQGNQGYGFWVTDGWALQPGGQEIGCDAEKRLTVTDGAAYSGYLLDKMMRPGGVYKVTYSNISGSAVYHTGLWDGNEPQYVDSNSEVKLNSTASELKMYFGVPSGTAAFRSMTVELYPTFYRVTQKSVNAANGSGPSYNTTYDYSGALMGMYDGEFYGHAQVTETVPDGTKNITYFYQDDARKGRAYRVDVTTSGNALISKTESEYSKVSYTDGSLQYEWAWVYLDSEVHHIYNVDGVEVGATRTEYDYDEELVHNTTSPSPGNYGNLKQKREYGSASGGSAYRTTNLTYNPNISDGKYIVSLPATETVKNAANQDIAVTQNTYNNEGLLTSMQKLISSGRYVQTDYEYDGYGNQNKVTVHNDSGDQVSMTTYDLTHHAYPKTVSKLLDPTNPSTAQTTTFEYDDPARDYLPTSMTDANGQTITAEYDSFGRVISITRPDPDTTLPNSTLTMTYDDDDADMPFDKTLTTTITLKPLNSLDQGSYSIVREYDGMGREIKNITGAAVTISELGSPLGHASVSGGVATTTTYVSATVTTKSMPGSSAVTTTTVNPNSRTTTVTAPDNTVTSSVEDGLVSTVTDAKGNSTTTTKDVWGRVTNVHPPQIGPDVNYTYNSLDQLTQVTRGGATTSMTYDLAGRKLTMNDADMGDWSYQYDAVGNLTLQTDARNCATTLSYDALNRLTAKTYSTACPQTPNVNYYYDGQSFSFNQVPYNTYTNPIGKRTGMVVSGSSAAVWDYDIRGRMLSEKDILPGNGATYNTYTTYYTYNPDDTMATMTYPDQEKLTYHYDSRMLLTKVTSDNATPTSTGDDVEYVSSTTYDPSGRIDDRVLGNGLTQDYTYYGWAEKVNEIGQGGRLKTLTTGGLQNLGYTYDKVGNITDINNATADEKQTYAYDALDRLTNWTASNTGVTPNEVTYQETYSYNTFTGNLESKANVKSNTSLDLLYTDATHKHAVTGAGANSYGYDPNGNMTARLVNGKNYQLAYDAENRLTEVRTDSAVPPTITSFGATTPVTNSLSIPIGPFTATDSGSVTGYMITTSTTAPLAGDTRWSPTAPGNFPVTEDGTYTLYPWAKDNEDNVSPINATLGRTVIVDRGIPTVTLNSAPPAVDGNKRASFTFTINDGPKGVIDLIKCKVDAYAYDDCTSPYTTPETPGLSNGPHTFSVYAVDTAGNTSPVVTHTWNVLHYQGTGADGSLTVASGATYNINTQNNGTRTCANGGDAVSYTVTGLTSTTATLSTTVAAGCLNAGDEVLLINVRGITSSYANAGNYESLLVSSVNGSVVTFTFAKQKLYGNNGGDTNLGTGATQQHVILQRVPNYNDVTVTGTLTASAWNGSKYGILAFRVKGILSGAGTIKADALGYVSAETYVGAGIAGYGAGTTYICCGGGGGYGTDGMGSGHGVAYGAANLDKLYFGSGGGASAAVRSEGRLLDPSYPGGSGGGILLIEGKDINFTGTLNANGVGNSISAATGSGAGGSIRIKGYDVNLNAKSVTGGTVGNAGGVGRIAVYYFNTTNVTANTTTFLQKLNLTAMNLQTPSLASLPVYEDVEVVWRHPHTVRIVSDSPAYKPLSTVSVLATFTYDGDGKRVKAVENGVTTLFIGNHYEVNQTTGQVTKYYFAGATRVAIGKYSIPQRMKVEYVLGDHLGSTSITTNMDGVKISEMRYKPWGEVRSAWYDPDLNDETKPNKITTPTYQLTRYTYTGQYSYMDDPSTTGVDGFGLMYYGARFYDPYLGRMAQADTIVPGGVQGLDRYAYVNNNPVNLIDPSGHCASEDDEDNCYEKLDQNHTDIVATISMIQKKFGNVTIKYSSKWNLADLQEIYSGLNTIMGKNGFNGDVEAFVAAMGEVTYVPVAVGSLGYDPNTNLPIPARADYKTGIIQVATNASTDNIIHEMGHIFSGTLTRENARVPSYRQMFPNVFDAGSGATLYGQASTVEDFADSFLAVIKYGPQAINKVDQPRIDTINALIQSYTNLDHTLSPGR